MFVQIPDHPERKRPLALEDLIDASQLPDHRHQVAGRQPRRPVRCGVGQEAMRQRVADGKHEIIVGLPGRAVGIEKPEQN
jgi:hypothetical protein